MTKLHKRDRRKQAGAQSTMAVVERMAALPTEVASAITKATSKSGARQLTDPRGLGGLFTFIAKKRSSRCGAERQTTTW